MSDLVKSAALAGATRRPISIVPFEPAHLALIKDRPEQHGEAERFYAARGASAEMGPAFSAVETDEEGRTIEVLACAGLAELKPPSAADGGRAAAWGYFADGLRPAQWATVTAAIRGVLDHAGYAQIDMLVGAGFAAAQHYAEALGFERSAFIYSRRAPPGGALDPHQPERAQ
jgi:hypothetical protein